MAQLLDLICPLLGRRDPLVHWALTGERGWPSFPLVGAVGASGGRWRMGQGWGGGTRRGAGKETGTRREGQTDPERDPDRKTCKRTEESRLSDAPSQPHTRRPGRVRPSYRGARMSRRTLTNSRDAPASFRPHPLQRLLPSSPTGSPISSSSEVIDLERREMAGGGSRLACWGAEKVTAVVRCHTRGEGRDPLCPPTVLPGLRG